MGDRTLRNREAIPPARKTSRSSSIAVGEPVKSVYVPGNETAAWTVKERREMWQKAREGAMYAGLYPLSGAPNSTGATACLAVGRRGQLCPM